MDPLDRALDQILDGYAAVEPAPGAVQSWRAHLHDPAPRFRFAALGAPAWMAIAVALALMLALGGLGWHRARLHAAQARLAAGEKTVLVPLPSSMEPPLTPRQKQLIQLMQTNPGALATQKPDAPAAAAPKVKHP